MKNLLSILLFYLFVSCNQINNDSNNEKNINSLYAEKTSELINSFIEEEYRFCEFLLEPNEGFESFDVYTFWTEAEFKEFLYKTFELKDEIDYNSLIGINEKLEIDQKLLKNKIKLVSRKEFDSIFSIKDLSIKAKAKEDFQKKYLSMCYMSKPIFDKDFKTAIIDFGIGGCLVSDPYIYRFINGKWE
ncbi:hypothetical protein [Lacinutrix mariniflava]|uniref:hypothetical protein n=1 Tax=Lacinutrix mariniflava TaxID=342955 RepID=UPI0006E4343C|nr:hypothetical protein [Lacinutrix mariniflava]